MAFQDSFSDYDLPIFDRGVRLPEIKITEAEKAALKLKPTTTNVNYLKNLCWQQCLKKKADGKIKQSLDECKERLRMEFEVFEKTGVIDYLLLLKDIFGWCDNNGVMRGPGRGSAAGSFSLYLIGLTNVNPFDHKLNFTRFLSEARAKPKYIDGIMYADGKTMADFDGDVSFLGRPKAIKRLEQDYAGKTCKIATLQYLTSKMALKDTLKIYLGYNESDAKAVSDNVESVFGRVEPLSETYNRSAEFRKWADEHPKAYKIALSLEGLVRTSGIHASGMLVSYYDILDVMPIQLSSSGEIVSAYDMNTALTVFVKADLLGLRTLDVVEEAIKAINISNPTLNFSTDSIDINDQVIYDYLANCDRYQGLFQIESGLTKQVVRKVKPKNIDQLAACLSISRPGALKFIDDYVKFVQTGEFKKIHPQIDSILIQTGGLILYQEQINTICQEVYKLSAVDADEVRRCISKKVRQDMAKWEPILYANGKEHGIPEAATNWFWSTCNASADYLFNANHCYSYSYITCYTTYIKARFPLEFFLGLLKLSQHESKPMEVINGVQKEMREFGFELLPPNIYKSKDDYSIDGKAILTGLTGVKGVSDKALERIKQFKKDNPTKFDIFESAKQAKVPVNIMSALIMSGCVDTYGVSRARMVLELETYNKLTEKEKPLVHKFGPQFNWDLCKIIRECGTTLKNEKGVTFIKESRLQTIRRDYEDYFQKFLKNSEHEELAQYVMESEFLGFSYSTTLKKIYGKNTTDLSTVYEAMTEPDNTYVRVAAKVLEVENRRSRQKKTPYLWMRLADESGDMVAMLFGGERIEDLKKFNSKELEEGDIVILNGKKSKDIVMVDSLSIQENPVVLRKRDLKLTEVAKEEAVA